MKNLLASFLAFIAFGSVHVSAQEIRLAQGTEVPLVLSQDVSSKTTQRGDLVGFTVDKDVTADGQVLIRQGTAARGSVIYAEKGGYLGHSGKLAIQVESTTTVDGQPVPLRAAKGGEGDSATGATIALSLLAGPFGLLKKGGDIVFKQGTPITVYTAEERRFTLEGAVLTAVAPANAAAVAGDGQMATVIVFRKKSIVGAALEPSVFYDGHELARMDNGRYFTFKLPPGKHVIHMTDDKKGYELNMAAGETYYFRVGIEAGMWKGKGKILLESADKGAEEIKKIKPLGSDKIVDKTLVSVGPDS
jgi:hypothetical protein